MFSAPDYYKWLLIPALLGVVIYLLLMTHTHPPVQISEFSSGEQIISESRRFIDKTGFNPGELEPYVTFRTNDNLLIRQIDHFGKKRVNDFIRNGFLRFIPSYHWQVLWIDTDDHEDISISLDSYKQPVGVTLFRTIHAPDGAIQAFHIDDHRGHNRIRDTETVRDSIDFDTIAVGNLESGNPFHPHIKQVISGTVWDNHMMSVDSVYMSVIDDHQPGDNITGTEPDNLFDNQGSRAGNIRLSPQNEIFEHLSTVTVTLSPDGQLYRIDQDVHISGYESRNSEGPIGLVRVIFYILAILLLLVIFFRRLFYRLIDVRTATIYAITAVGIMLVHLVHMFIQGSAFEFVDQQILQILAIIMGFLLLSGLIGILVFMVSGLSESLTREIWPDKITSLSLIRLGYLKSKRVGRSIATGVPLALIFLGVASIMYSMTDHSYLNPLEDHFFYTDSYLFPPWQLFVNSLFWMFLISAGLYACFISWIAINNNHTTLLLLAGGLAFSLMSAFHIETSDSLLVITYWFIPGLVVTYTYLRYDLLTLFISVFLFFAAWSVTDGLLVSGSQDSLLAWSVYLFMALFLCFGFYLVKYGREYDHIPELTPKYIREIAREQRVERELEIAHHVHQSFLPVNLPSLKGLKIAASCQAAFDVGGDYYDVVPIDRHRTAFMIGDVSGKGIQAAFYMTMVKGIFQSLVKEIPDPVPLLSRMNRIFYDNARRGSFISVCYGLMDERTGTLRYARAGHNPAILLRSGDQRSEILRSDGLAIGLTSGREFEDGLSEQSVQLNQGDVLVFYTDGFTEATNIHNEMFGDDRLRKELEDHHKLKVDQLLVHMSSTLRNFTAGATINDDMTMVIVKYDKEDTSD